MDRLCFPVVEGNGKLGAHAEEIRVDAQVSGYTPDMSVCDLPGTAVGLSAAARRDRHAHPSGSCQFRSWCSQVGYW